MSWLFPGKAVRVNAPCLDCGEPLVVEMRDGQVLLAQPDTMVGYAAKGFRGPHEEWAYR